MEGSDYTTLFLYIDMVTVSDQEIIESSIPTMIWPRHMTNYTLVPDQPQRAVYHDLRDIIGKEVIGTDFQEQECTKQWGPKRCD